MDTATDLERLIERRSTSDPGPDEREESYMEWVRRFHARRREMNRWEWVRYFDRMAVNHAAISKDYQCRAEALCENANERKETA